MNINAQNTFTTPTFKNGGEGYSVSISGTFVATVVTQRSKDKVDWFDVHSTSSPVELDGQMLTGYWVRAGVKTGGYTSGTAVVDVY